jgi:hypothetical protein
MKLNEVVKSFLQQPERKNDDKSSLVKDQHTLVDLTNDDNIPATGSFFDNDLNSNLYGQSDVNSIVTKQKQKIKKYREIANTPDVVDAIDEIVNEVVFSYDDKIPLKLNMEMENDKLQKAISEKFEKILKLMNIRRNLNQIVRQTYTDGKMIFHCAYDKKGTKNGINSIKLIDPCGLYYDGKDGCFKYLREEEHGYTSGEHQELKYNIEEIVQEDFGIYESKLNLSYLEYAIKPANMLKTLEDLLVPLRFSRSISRRVFNVDIGDLPVKRGTEVMSDYQAKFKYKKFYNNDTGEVSNQQHITSMVEDYWFANRSGGKGTTVDVLDESGNLGELDDILYFSKKLYRALKIPSNRIRNNPDADQEYDFDTTRVTKEDMKFFMFISRLRQVYSSVFKEILKREVISCGIMSEKEWENMEADIEITFVEENKFIEKMNLSILQEKIGIYAEVKEYAGTLFSHKEVMKQVFRLSDEEIEDRLKEIAKEKKDPKFKDFYVEDEGF